MNFYSSLLAIINVEIRQLIPKFKYSPYNLGALEEKG